MLPLSFNTNCLRNLSLERAIEETSRAGYEGIDIFCLSEHLHPFDVTKTQLGELRNQFDRLSINPVSLATGGPFLLSDDAFEPSLISPDARARNERISLIKAALEVANALSIPVVQFVSGIRQTNVPPEEAIDMLIEAVRTCLKHAGEATLVLEPEAPLPMSLGGGSCFIEKTSQAIPIIVEVDAPQFRLNMDITHVQCCEDDLLSCVAAALPYTRHVHVADVKGGVHHHEIPGEGDIDFRSVLGVLKASRYEHYLSVELHAHSNEWENALYQSRRHLLEQM